MPANRYLSSLAEGETLQELVAADWAELDHMQPNQVPAGWRHSRLIYELTLPTHGWFIDIESSRSIAAIESALGADVLRPYFRDRRQKHLTTAMLRGEDRTLTTRIAEWAHGLQLEDGSRAHGIRYGSKHGSDLSCWAIWLRQIDAGRSVDAEPTHADAGSVITPEEDNPPLRDIADLFKLRCY